MTQKRQNCRTDVKRYQPDDIMRNYLINARLIRKRLSRITGTKLFDKLVV